MAELAGWAKAHWGEEQFEWDATQLAFPPEPGNSHSLKDHKFLLV